MMFRTNFVVPSLETTGLEKIFLIAGGKKQPKMMVLKP